MANKNVLQFVKSKKVKSLRVTELNSTYNKVVNQDLRIFHPFLWVEECTIEPNSCVDTHR